MGRSTNVCAMIDDWDIRHNRADLPPEVWAYLKEQGFLGMLIGKEHGGLGFSAQAQSQVVSKVASRSVAAGITVMVPNSLGPGELLEKYGTPEQKAKYLRRLAKGAGGAVLCADRPLCRVRRGEHARRRASSPTTCIEGKKTLGVKLSWDKRYITLAPVATLVGLAFHLHDPDHLIGETDNIGITLALIPASFPGVEIGRRHFPARAAFMNGPIKGRNVFIPMEFLIGGIDYAGQGWRMLMECLSTGRAISLPAIGTVSIKQSLRVTSAYARIRRQFGIAVGIMEGVADPLSRMVRSAYTFEAARGLTASMVDEGQKPAVISALLKYRTTEAMRDRVNDALDIHGGRAVQDGPSNYLFSGYMTTPVAITVEGANILTRTLITFAQGALRAHPYLYAEIAAAQDTDRRARPRRLRRGVRRPSQLHAAQHGRQLPPRAELRALRLDAGAARDGALVPPAGALFAELCAGRRLDGGVPRRRPQAQAAALRPHGRHPVRSLSAVGGAEALRGRGPDQGGCAAGRRHRHAIICLPSSRALRRCSPISRTRSLRWAMRVLVFPLGRHQKPASDRETYRLARAVLRPGRSATG